MDEWNTSSEIHKLEWASDIEKDSIYTPLSYRILIKLEILYALMSRLLLEDLYKKNLVASIENLDRF